MIENVHIMRKNLALTKLTSVVQRLRHKVVLRGFLEIKLSYSSIEQV